MSAIIPVAAANNAEAKALAAMPAHTAGWRPYMLRRAKGRGLAPSFFAASMDAAQAYAVRHFGDFNAAAIVTI